MRNYSFTAWTNSLNTRKGLDSRLRCAQVNTSLNRFIWISCICGSFIFNAARDEYSVLFDVVDLLLLLFSCSSFNEKSSQPYSVTLGYTFAASASMRSSGREDAGVEGDNQLLSSCHSKSGASPTHRRMNILDLLPRREEK